MSQSVRQSTSAGRAGRRRRQRVGQVERRIDGYPAAGAPGAVLGDPRAHLVVPGPAGGDTTLQGGGSASTSASACALLPERAPPRTRVSRGSGEPFARPKLAGETWPDQARGISEQQPEDEIRHRRRDDEAAMQLVGHEVRIVERSAGSYCWWTAGTLT